MKLRSKHIVPIIIVAFAGGIGLTMALNLWQTESSKIPAKFQTGEFAGEYNPGDIRGSYSFGDIQSAFSVPVADLAKAFGVETADDPAAVKAKDFEEMYGAVEQGEIGTDSIRLFVALYLDLPYEPEDTTLLPGPAISVLRERLSEEKLEELKPITVSLSGLKPAATTEEHEVPDDTIIRGRTTFQELLNWGLSKTEIEEAIGMEMGKPGVTVRDYLAEKQMEFKDAKDKLQVMVDAKQSG